METKQSLRTLVEISNTVLNQLIESGGELTPEMEAQLAQVEINLPVKVDGYAAIMERLEMEEAYWKEKAAKFIAVARGCTNVRDRLKESLKFAMSELGTTEILGNDVKFKLSNSKPKMIIDPDTIDKAYTMQVTTTEIDKKRIEEDLKMGVPVQGARLEETKSIRQYVNKAVK